MIHRYIKTLKLHCTAIINGMTIIYSLFYEGMKVFGDAKYLEYNVF